MERLWQQGEATVREVLDALNAAADKERAYTTVMTVMGNLARKGLLARRREGKTDFYRPVLSRDAYLQARARAEAGELVGRYGEEALVAFAREMDRLDSTRRQRLRRLARGG